MTGLAAPTNQWGAHDTYAVFEFDSVLEITALIAELQFFLASRRRWLFGGWGNYPRVLRERCEAGARRLLLNDSAFEAAHLAGLVLPQQAGTLSGPDDTRCDLLVG